MTLTRVGTFVIVLLVTLAQSAQAAQAKPEDGWGCPQGYVAFNAQTGQGGPASYLPGEEVIASGYLTDATTKAAPSVTLRWGAADGDAVGEAALDADGNFTGLRFTIPAGMPHAVYTVYLEAFGADGKMLPGLPIPTRLRVGPPPASPRAATGTGADPVAVASPTRRRAARPKTPARSKALARSKAPAPRPVVAAPVAPVARRAEAPARPTRVHRAAEARSRVRPARRTRSEAAAPRRARSPQTSPVPRPSRPPVSTPAVRGGHTEGDADPLGPWTLAGLLGLLGLAALVRRRRRRSDGPLPVPLPRGPDLHELQIEAELQEIVAEARAAEAVLRTPETEFERLLR